jgi:hypothetical protein
MLHTYHYVLSILCIFWPKQGNFLKCTEKTLNYRLFKNKFEFENYFNILDDRDIFTFCRFRLNNHKVSIEYGRWNNIPRELRICNLCNTADLGDEF